MRSARSAHGRAPRGAWILLSIGVLATGAGCSATERIASNAMPAATATMPSVSWAPVEVAKPLPTAAAALVSPESEPEPVADAAPTQEALPLITMEIVDDQALPDGGGEIGSDPNPTGKYVLVSISEQHLYAYENGELVFSFVASTGMDNSTRAGSFRVLDKIPNAYGASWDIWMPNWMGIYWSGTLENGIHALPILPNGARLWAGYLGTPISYGCVVLGVEDAHQLYEWAEIGTPVEVRW